MQRLLRPSALGYFHLLYFFDVKKEIVLRNRDEN